MDWSELEPKRPKTYALGEDLSKLSIDELKALAERLQAEIARVEAAMGDKQSSKAKAEQAFRR
jgi:uncharacterized small protein (DUF1192 family)